MLALICKPLLEENLINIEGPKLTDVSDKAVPEQKLESASNRNDGRILIGAEFLCDLLNHMFCSCEIIKKLPFSIQMTVVNNVVQSESNEEKKEVETIKLITDVMLNCSSIQVNLIHFSSIVATSFMIVKISLDNYSIAVVFKFVKLTLTSLS